MFEVIRKDPNMQIDSEITELTVEGLANRLQRNRKECRLSGCHMHVWSSIMVRKFRNETC